MLGQATLFNETAPDAKLRTRVSVALAERADVLSVLKHKHYLGRGRVGRQLNYLVYLDGVVEGVITFAYPMMSADLEGIPSDELVEFARLSLAHNPPHVASCAIGKVLRRVKTDWSTRFPDAKPLRAVVSWSDSTRHVGTVYKAANFRFVRRCRGAYHGNAATSKRGVREKHGDYNHDKDCWLYMFEGRKKP